MALICTPLTDFSGGGSGEATGGLGWQAVSGAEARDRGSRAVRAMAGKGSWRWWQVSIVSGGGRWRRVWGQRKLRIRAGRVLGSRNQMCH